MVVGAVQPPSGRRGDTGGPGTVRYGGIVTEEGELCNIVNKVGIRTKGKKMWFDLTLVMV